MMVVSLTSTKWYVSKLLPSGGVVVEVTLRVELHPLHPGIFQTMVDCWGDADLVADRNGVSCSSLRGNVHTSFSSKPSL